MRWNVVKLTAVVACVLAVTGCGIIPRERDRMGWRFEVERIPSLDVVTPMLVNRSAGQVNATSIATVGGPVAGGGLALQGAVQQLPTSYVPPCPPSISLNAACPPPIAVAAPAVAPAPGLSPEQLCELLRLLGTARPPAPYMAPVPGVREGRTCDR